MYDYVIVGAGSAGCVWRRAWARIPTFGSRVIEAGPPDDAPELHIPLAFRQL